MSRPVATLGSQPPVITVTVKWGGTSLGMGRQYCACVS